MTKMRKVAIGLIAGTLLVQSASQPAIAGPFKGPVPKADVQQPGKRLAPDRQTRVPLLKCDRDRSARKVDRRIGIVYYRFRLTYYGDTPIAATELKPIEVELYGPTGPQKHVFFLKNDLLPGQSVLSDSDYPTWTKCTAKLTEFDHD